MSQTASPPRRRWRGWLGYGLTILVTAGVTFGVVALLMNIAERKREGQEHYVRLVELDETTIDPAIWGKNFPRQYDSYLLTADSERTGYGGSDALAPSKLDADPRLKRIFAGYAFGVEQGTQQPTENAARRIERTAVGAEPLQHPGDVDCTASGVAAHVAAAQLVLHRHLFGDRRDVDGRVQRYG